MQQASAQQQATMSVGEKQPQQTQAGPIAGEKTESVLPTECDVLIIGSGPVGLALGHELLRHGMKKVCIIDKAKERVPYSKAFSIHGRTLELFNQMGIVDQFLEKAAHSSQINYVWPSKKRISVQLSGIPAIHYQGVFFISQAETEGILEASFMKMGGQVHREVELLSMQSLHADGNKKKDDAAFEGPLLAHLRDVNGEERKMTCRYMVGCDGAHSSTRKLLGLPFHGSPYLENFLLADVHMDNVEVDRGATFWLGRKRPLVMFHLAKPNLYRLITIRSVEKPGDSDKRKEKRKGEEKQKEKEAKPTLEEFQEVVDQFKLGVKLHDAKWLSVFRLHRRGVERYRVGDVFLAGDAAHVHSPAGGQGMNLGIHDSYNLAWKIALVHLKGATPTLLETYNTERHPIGREVLHSTDQLTYIMFSNHLLSRLLRDFIVPLLLTIPYVRYMFVTMLAMLHFQYRASPIVQESGGWLWWKGPRAGDRAPDGQLSTYPVGGPAGGKEKQVVWLHDRLKQQQQADISSNTATNASTTTTTTTTSDATITATTKSDAAVTIDTIGSSDTTSPSLVTTAPDNNTTSATTTTTFTPPSTISSSNSLPRHTLLLFASYCIGEKGVSNAVEEMNKEIGSRYVKEGLMSIIVILPSVPVKEKEEKKKEGKGEKDGGACRSGGEAVKGVVQILVDDVQGRVGRLYGVSSSSFLSGSRKRATYLLRPDGYIALRAEGWEGKVVRDYLTTRLFVEGRKAEAQ